MAATAADIVSLKRAKFELRVPLEDDGHDEYIAGLIDSAVSTVAADISVPLVDEDAAMDLMRPRCDNDFLAVNDNFAVISDRTLVRYTEDEAALLAATITDLEQRIELTRHGRRLMLRPASGAWPTITDFNLRIRYKRGVVVGSDKLINAYQQAVILMLRNLYTGSMQIKSDSAYKTITRALARRWDTWQDSQIA